MVHESVGGPSGLVRVPPVAETVCPAENVAILFPPNLPGQVPVQLEMAASQYRPAARETVDIHGLVIAPRVLKSPVVPPTCATRVPLAL